MGCSWDLCSFCGDIKYDAPFVNYNGEEGRFQACCECLDILLLKGMIVKTPDGYELLKSEHGWDVYEVTLGNIL
jgi:hypothetical protein